MPHKIIPGSFADWANYRLRSRNGTYPKPTVGPDYEALDEAKAKAMDRFLRDYDDYCDQAWAAVEKEAEAAERDAQYILNLEINDDD